MSVRRIIVNSQVSGTPPKKAPGFIRESQSTKSSAPPEELAFLKAENTRLEGELQASVDNLLIVVDEVKFLEDDVENKKKEVTSLKSQVNILTDQLNAGHAKATSNHIQDDLRKQLEELQEAKGHWVVKEGRLSDNVRALESQLSQEKKRRNELYHDRVILVEHLTKNLPDVDVPKLLGHSLDDEPISAVLPEGASLSLESLLDLPPFTSDIDGLKRQLFEAHRRLETLHSEYKSLQQDVSYSHDVMKNVASENDSQASKLEQMNKANSELVKEKEEMSRTIEAMKRESVRLEHIAESTDRFLKDAQVKNSELERSLVLKEEDMKTFTQVKATILEEATRDKDVVRQLEQLLKKAREQLLALQADNNALRGSLHTLDQIALERDELQRQLNDFRTEKEALAVKLAETGKQYDGEFTKVTKDKEKLAKDLASLEDEHGKVKEDAEKSRTALEQEKLKLEQLVQQLEEEKKKLETELASTSKNSSQLQQSLEKARDDKATLERASNNTNEELAMTREELLKVVAHNNSFLRSIASVRSTNESKTELEDLRVQLGDALALLHTTEQELFDNKQYKLQFDEVQASRPTSSPLAPPPTSAVSPPAPPSTPSSPAPPAPSLATPPPPPGKLLPKKQMPFRLAPLPTPDPAPATPEKATTSPEHESDPEKATADDSAQGEATVALDMVRSVSQGSAQPAQARKSHGASKMSDGLLSTEDLKRLLDEERWKLEEAIRESADLALKLRETEELLRKENTIVSNKFEKALLASQQVAEKHARTAKERDEFAAQLAEAQSALEDKERVVVDKDKELKEKEKALEEKERALSELRKAQLSDAKVTLPSPLPPLLKPGKIPTIIKPKPLTNQPSQDLHSPSSPSPSSSATKDETILGDDSFDFDAEAENILASLSMPPSPAPAPPPTHAPKPPKSLKPTPSSPAPPTSSSSSVHSPTLTLVTPPTLTVTTPPTLPTSPHSKLPAPQSSVFSSIAFAYSELTESERQVRDLESLIKSLRQDLIDSKAQCDKLNVEKQGLQKDIARLQSTLEDHEKMKTAAAGLMGEHGKKTEAENSDLRKKLEISQKDLAEYRKRLEEAQERFNLAKENLLFMQQMQNMRKPDKKEVEKEKEKEKDGEKEKERGKRGRDKSRGRERERERGRDRSRGASRGKERRKDREGDSGSDREREGDDNVQRKTMGDENWEMLERGKELERARERAMARLREEERDRERAIEKQKEREWDQEKDRAREREKEREQERAREKDKAKEWEREKDRLQKDKEEKNREEKRNREREEKETKEASNRRAKESMKPMEMDELQGKELPSDQRYKDIFYNQVVERLENELSLVQKENEDLRNAIHSRDPLELYQQKFFAVAEENEGLKQDLSALEEDRNHLAGELDSLRLQLQELVTEREALAEQFENVYSETVERLQNEIKQAQESASRHSISFGDSGGHSTIDDMHVKLNNMALNTKNHSLEQQIEALNQECARMGLIKNELEAKLREQMHQVRELQREKSAASEATALKSLDLEKKTLDFEKLARELDKKARELEKKTQEVERKAQEIERLQKEITKLHDELFAEKSRVAEAEKSRMALESRVRDAERSSNDLERRGNSLLQEIEKTREGQSGVSHELHEAQASVERLLKDNLELERRLFEKEQSLKDANSKLIGHRADIEKMNSIVFEAGTDTDSLKHRTAELQASRYAARLQDQLKVVTTERDGLQVKVRELKQELLQAKKKNSDSFLSSGKVLNIDNVALILENRLSEAHRKLQLVEQENSDLHSLLVDSQLSLNEYAQDVEDQMLQYTPHHYSSASHHSPMTLHNLSRSSSLRSPSSTPPPHFTPPPPPSSSTRSSSYGQHDSFLRTHSRNS